MKASALRKGNVVMYNNAPHRIMDFYHHTPGNLRAMVQAKMRNLLTGLQTEHRFSSTEEVPDADVVVSKATYLYRDNEGFHFMNSETYDQFMMGEEALGDAVYYLQDQMEVDVTIYNDDPIGVLLPPSVVLTVVETEPEMKGATASASPKPAKTDTGLTLSVPPFVSVGQKIVVNTDGGTYLRRAD